MIPEEMKVDFSPYRKSLIEQALSRLLYQHQSSSVLRQFVTAILEEVQELYDALVDLQEMRTVYMAEEENLDALGRIVGQKRAGYEYSDVTWFVADRANQETDRLSVWCLQAPLAEYTPAKDTDYRQLILARAACNHAKFSSTPELQELIRMVTGVTVSFERTSPMGVRVLVPATISTTNLILINRFLTDLRVDDAPTVPYPATLHIDEITIFLPEVFFCADRVSQGCDKAPCAVGTIRSILDA